MTRDGRADTGRGQNGTPALLWALGAGAVLAALCYFGLGPGRAIHRASDFGGHTLYTSFVVVTAALLLWRGAKQGARHVLWWPPVVGAGTVACVEGLKRLTHLPRPDGEPTGFPSGHTTFAFALAWLLSRTHPRLAPLWYGVAVFIGWSRVEGDAHFPYQVLCGAALGTLIGLAISRGLRGGRPASLP